MVNKPIGLLISDKIYNKSITVYQANGERDNSAEEVIEHLQRDVAISHAKAIKFKLGGRMSHTETPAGRSEKLIPLVRKTFGDQDGHLRRRQRLLHRRPGHPHRQAHAGEQVRLLRGARPLRLVRETRQVADALEIPIAGGEQEPSTHNFRWLIANGGLSIVQQDMFYFGGMIRCMQVARMAAAFGKQCIPHISATGLGYVYMMHFVSAIPNSGPYHEFKEFNDVLPYHCETSTLRSDSEGVIKVPTGPGFGVDIDPGFIKKATIVIG